MWTKRERIFLALSVVLLIFSFINSRTLAPVNAKENISEDLYKELRVFTDVLAIVQRDYVTKPGSSKLVKGAIKGMLTTLDPHSGYLDPEFYQDLRVQTTGEFGGLGIEITIRDGRLIVVAPMEGSPAEDAGIIAGDVIVKIEGKYTTEFSLVDAVKRLRGPKGSPILISIEREGASDLIDVTVVRDNITVKSVRHRYLGDNFGYVRLNQFMEKTADDLKGSLVSLAKSAGKKGLNGLILDLRNNPGGLLTQAIRVSDMFLDSGVIVYTDGRVKNQRQKFFAHPRGTEEPYRIIVLVNNGSASASEIVAGALKDHGRALILGTQTFGKGSVQTITPLDNGGALTLTTALYYTKSGRSLQAEGVKPDIIIENEPIKIVEAEEETKSNKRKPRRFREKDLPGAIKNPSTPDGAEPMRKLNKVPEEKTEVKRMNLETVPLEEWFERDAQLRRALELLKTSHIFNTKPAVEKDAA